MKWASVVLVSAMAFGVIGCGGGDSGGTGGTMTVGPGAIPTAGTGAPAAGNPAIAPTAGTMGTAGTAAPVGAPMAGMGDSTPMAGGDPVTPVPVDDMMGVMDPPDPGDPMDPEMPPTTDREDLGEGDGQDVVTIGDSFMNLSLVSGTEQSLAKVSGRTYRNYAVAGTRVLNGQIPGQYDRAVSDDPDIKTVIMTGGGNDVILDFFGTLIACQGAATEAELSQTCLNDLQTISEGVQALITRMGEDGVQDVIYVGYGYVTNNELGGTIEWTRNRQAELCNGNVTPGGARCHFVDPAEALIGTISPAGGGDGIHPSNAGYDIIAEMVWERMQAEGVRR